MKEMELGAQLAIGLKELDKSSDRPHPVYHTICVQTCIIVQQAKAKIPEYLAGSLRLFLQVRSAFRALLAGLGTGYFRVPGATVGGRVGGRGSAIGGSAGNGGHSWFKIGG